MIYDEDMKFCIKEDVEYYMHKYRNGMYNKICTAFNLIYVDNTTVSCIKCRHCEMNAVEGMSVRYAI